MAFRIFYDRFDAAITEIQQLTLKGNEIIIYDRDTANITNPIVIKHKKNLDLLYPDYLQVVVRSAINNDIQNVTLDHGEIIGQADNSLKDLYKLPQYKFGAFGDYAGVKKDELTAGGSISPGMVFYNPDENLYHGFRGPTKSLEEFEKTIIPAVVHTGFVQEWIATKSDYIKNNQGYDRLINLRDGNEPSKNQAKFKWISIMHYLHCIRTMLAKGLI